VPLPDPIGEPLTEELESLIPGLAPTKPPLIPGIQTSKSLLYPAPAESSESEQLNLNSIEPASEPASEFSRTEADAFIISKASDISSLPSANTSPLITNNTPRDSSSLEVDPLIGKLDSDLEDPLINPNRIVSNNPNSDFNKPAINTQTIDSSISGSELNKTTADTTAASDKLPENTTQLPDASVAQSDQENSQKLQAVTADTTSEEATSEKTLVTTAETTSEPKEHQTPLSSEITLKSESEPNEVSPATASTTDKPESNKTLPTENSTANNLETATNLEPDKTSTSSTSINFDSNAFSVDEKGIIGIEFISDGGWYTGQLAIVSLKGMEKFVPGSEEFIFEAATRALSNSTNGYIVISDNLEGAYYTNLNSSENFNSGQYLGTKTFAMTPGDKFFLMLVPNGTVQQVYDNPAISGDKKPLFSIATENPSDSFSVGQIADITGEGQLFVMEDMALSQGSYRDYDDITFRVTGATSQILSLSQLVGSSSASIHSELVQKLKGESDKSEEKFTAKSTVTNFGDTFQGEKPSITAGNDQQKPQSTAGTVANSDSQESQPTETSIIDKSDSQESEPTEISIVDQSDSQKSQPIVDKSDSQESEPIETSIVDQFDSQKSEPTETSSDSQKSEQTEILIVDKFDSQESEPTETSIVDKSDSQESEPTETSSDSQKSEQTEILIVDKFDSQESEPTETSIVDKSDSQESEPTETSIVDKFDSQELQPILDKSDSEESEPTETSTIDKSDSQESQQTEQTASPPETPSVSPTESNSEIEQPVSPETVVVAEFTVGTSNTNIAVGFTAAELETETPPAIAVNSLEPEPLIADSSQGVQTDSPIQTLSSNSSETAAGTAEIAATEESGQNPDDVANSQPNLTQRADNFQSNINSPANLSITAAANSPRPGTFLVENANGQVKIDYQFDGGFYEGELGIFSLSGMEALTPGSREFIAEAGRRILTNSTQGYVVISDSKEGAKFTGSMPFDKDWGKGEYQGIKTFSMTPGDTFALMLVPIGTVQSALQYSKRPLFSIASANPNDTSYILPIADATGTGNTFALEDMSISSSDRDYNDLIFTVIGAKGNAPLLDTVINPAKEWRNTTLGQELIKYANSLVEPTEPSDTIILVEGEIFANQYSRTLTVPTSGSILNISLSDINFDTNDPKSINDALEIALVDNSGKSLVPTISPGKNAFFNSTEGQQSQLAPGVTLQRNDHQRQLITNSSRYGCPIASAVGKQRQRYSNQSRHHLN
jgi:hypothetical protein